MSNPSNRGADGRFAVGNPGGPGNPHARTVARLRSALLAAVTEEDLRAIVSSLVQRARAGDVPATRLLFDRLLGKVAEATNPDRLDVEELELADTLDRLNKSLRRRNMSIEDLLRDMR